MNNERFDPLRVSLLMSSGAAPLPGFHKWLSVTVTTFAVFPWMYLLGGDDNCMSSVPSRICCWQCGEVCQAIADAAFTLFTSAL